MTIENLILNGGVHTLFSENKTNVKTSLSEMKMLASQYIELFEDFFACKLN